MAKTAPGGCFPCNAGIPVSQAFAKQASKSPNSPYSSNSPKSQRFSKDNDDGDHGILRIKHVLRSRPMNINVLAIPNKRYALSSWKQATAYLAPDKLEQLKGIVQGRYMGIDISKCTNAIYTLRKKQDADRAKANAANQFARCNKEDCTLVAMLLQKLKSINITSERRSLTCIIFNELCKFSAVDPSKMPESKKVVALLVAKKLGAWIDNMMAKKSTVVCNDMTLNPKAVTLNADLIDCPCMKNKQPEILKLDTSLPAEEPKEKGGGKKKGKKGKKGKKKF